MADNRIGVDDAIEYAGRWIYGKDWIDPLAPRKRWWVKKYVEGNPNDFGQIAYLVAGRRWVEYPSDPALVAKIEQALDDADWRKKQIAEVRDWLEERGFDLDAETFSIEELSNELKRSFPNAIGIADFRLDGAELRHSPDDADSTAPESLPKPRKGGRPGDLGERYRAEFHRRREAKIPLCASKAAEAAAIVDALQKCNRLPKNPPPSVRTAENAITELYNLAKTRPNAA